MDLNETLCLHIAHPLRCLVLPSLFFSSFSFAQVRQFLVVKKNSEEVHYFPSTVEPLYNGQLTTEESGQFVVRWPSYRG